MARRRVLGRLARNAAMSAAGDVLSSGFSAVKGLAGSIAGAARGLSNLADQQDQPVQQNKTSNVIYVNFGMAGTAGKQKVAGGGTLPPPKAVKASGVNQNMPTDKLLNVAIKQLTSINSTLKKQLEFDKKVYDQAIAAEREAAIESPTSPFGNIKDRLSGLVDTQGAADRAKGLFSGKTLLAGLGLLGAGSLILGSLDNSEFNKLTANVEQFKTDYKWLFDLSKSIGTGLGVGGFMGYVLGGVKGILPGMVIGVVADYLGIENTAGAVAGGYAAYRVGKTGFDIYRRVQKIQKIRSAPRADPRLRGTGFRDPRTGRAASRQAVQAGGGWLSGTTGRKFVAYISRKKGAVFLKAIIRLLGRVTAGLAVTATGVGVIPGLLWTALSVAFAISDVMDIIDLWNGFQEEEELKKDAEAVTAGAAAEPDATRTAGSAAAPALAAERIKSRSETGQPEEAQAFFESRGWTKEQAAGIVGNLVVESGLRTDAVGDGGQAYGIAQWHPDRQNAFRQVYGKDIRNSSFQEQLNYVDWELRNTEARAGNLLRNATTAEEAAAIVDRSYERSAGYHLAERQANAAAIMAGDYAKVSTGGAAGYEGPGGAVGAMAINAIETTARLLGGVAGQLVGPTSLRNTAEPLTSGTDRSKEIGQKSTELDAIMKFGSLDARQKSISTPSTPTAVLQAANPSGTISVIDPNWHGLGDSKNPLYKYLANSKMAA